MVRELKTPPLLTGLMYDTQASRQFVQACRAGAGHAGVGPSESDLLHAAGCNPVPWAVKDQLQRRADEEGRSLSGLLAFLLERALIQ